MGNPSHMVNTDALAQVLGKTRQRVNQLASEGVLHRVKAGKWDLAENARRYIAYLENGTDRGTDDIEKERLQAEADWKRHKADLAKLQLQELEGEMHRSEDVEAVTTDLVYTIRSMMLALPGRVAVDLAQMNTAAEISSRMQEEVYDLLERLSEYQYDPDEYAKRVREREGWREAGDDDDEYPGH